MGTTIGTAMIASAAFWLLLLFAAATLVHAAPDHRGIYSDQQQQQGVHATAAALATAPGVDGHQRKLMQRPRCRNGTRLCGSSCVKLTDPAACGPTCARCPKPAANGVATCSKRGVCGVALACAEGFAPAGKADCRLPCPPGQQQQADAATGRTSCVVCAANSFKSGTNTNRCRACPKGSQTFGTTAQKHDELADCFAGGLIASKQKVGSPAEDLASFRWEFERALDNTGAKRTTPRRPKRACLFRCDGVPHDQAFSQHVAHIAGAPSVYYSNDASHVRSGVNLVSSVRDQQGCGTCVSHALASAAETAVAAATRTDASRNRVSISHTFSYFCAADKRGSTRSCGTGWEFEQALDAMTDGPAAFSMNSSCLRGVDPAVDQLSDAELGEFCTTGLACTKPWFTCKYKAVSDGMAQVQRYIRLHGSVVTRIMVTDSFMSFFESNPTGVFNGTTTGKAVLHAVQLIGYNNEEGFFLAKNSMGIGWGDQGLFRIAFGVADVAFTEDTYTLTDCQPTSTDPSTVAAWSDRWPVVADDDRPGCVLYTATERDTISGIVDHFQVRILDFVSANTERGVIPTRQLGDPPRPEPQLHRNPTWAGKVFRVCGIPGTIYNRVAADPCTTATNYCNGREIGCVAGRCVCHEEFSGRFCEQGDAVQRRFTMPSGESFVWHLSPELNWTDAQQSCEQEGMRLARLYNPVHAAEVYRQVLQHLPRSGSIPSMWLGLNDRQEEGRWAWVRGNSSEAAAFFKPLWRVGEPSNPADGENCLDMWTHLAYFTVPYNELRLWSDVPCNATRSTLCGPAEDSSDPCVRFPCSSAAGPVAGCVAAAAAGSNNGRQCLCGAGLVYVSDEVGCQPPALADDVEEFMLAGVPHSLHASPQTTWTEADRICRERGMALATVASADYAQQLNNAVVVMFETRGIEDYSFWIGLNDRASEEEFVWAADGTAVGAYQPWESGQPDNKCTEHKRADGSCMLSGEDCVSMRVKTGQWRDIPCWNKARFVCSQATLT